MVLVATTERLGDQNYPRLAAIHATGARAKPLLGSVGRTRTSHTVRDYRTAMNDDLHSSNEQDDSAERPNAAIHSPAGVGNSFIDLLSIQLRRFLRALLFIVVGTVSGVLVGFGAFLVLQAVWEMLFTWQTPTPVRPRGGDPIDRWARGYVMMFYCCIVTAPFAAVGLWLGVRVAFLGPVSLRQLFQEIGILRQRCVALVFSASQLWGRFSLLLAVAFWPVAFGGLSSLGSRDSPAGLCVVLFFTIAASTACGAKGLTSHPRRIAITGLVLSGMNAAVLSRFLYQIGLERPL